MENYIYYTPTKVYFGKDEELKIGKIIREYNPHSVLIVYGGNSIKRIGLYDKVIKSLKEENIQYLELSGVIPNPELPLVYEGIKLAKENDIDFVLAIGGGSVMDTAKDIANGVANPEDDVWDYHLGKKKPTKTIRKGTILTISASGSEMSNSCVISNPSTQEKRGYGSDLNRFDFAIENPELTYSVSKYQTACGIVDIAMHTIERYFDLGEETNLVDDIALAVIKNVFKFGQIAYQNPTDYQARAELMWASSLAHNGLTHSGRRFLLTVHQLEHVLSAFDSSIAHGAGLAALWCSWARYTYKYCFDRFLKYVHEIWNIEGNDENAILEGIKKQEEYYQSIGMPTSLKELNIKKEDLEMLALKCSQNKNRTIPGYCPLGYQEILDIYNLAFEPK
ncbi:MAG: iron-containing alcohol dehydrogenase [Bacilli bacterium]|nr:iron-containing alcohol dehydrogenase [Bacilli bacterium]